MTVLDTGPASVCENCRWWDSSTQHALAEVDTTGLCRVKPPVADERNGGAVWPFTEHGDWCAAFATRPRADGQNP